VRAGKAYPAHTLAEFRRLRCARPGIAPAQGRRLCARRRHHQPDLASAIIDAGRRECHACALLASSSPRSISIQFCYHGGDAPATLRTCRKPRPGMLRAPRVPRPRPSPSPTSAWMVGDRWVRLDAVFLRCAQPFFTIDHSYTECARPNILPLIKVSQPSPRPWNYLATLRLTHSCHSLTPREIPQRTSDSALRDGRQGRSSSISIAQAYINASDNQTRP